MTKLMFVEGRTAAKIIKTNPIYVNIPIVVITVYAMKGYSEKFLMKKMEKFKKE